MIQPTKALGELRIADSNQVDDDARTPAEKDFDRILYSSYFRRLSGVTQIVSPQDGSVLHDRMTHSLKVGAVGRTITSWLNTNYPNREPMDPATVFAAGVLHDIGHPPFGHAVEKELQAVLSGKIDRSGAPLSRGHSYLRDTFEGNAQTFRIACRLSVRKPLEEAGLNLTWRTLSAALKYPWVYGENPPSLPDLKRKWSAYDSEKDFLATSIERQSAHYPGLAGPTRGLEAEVMDWADDVAYAVHDIEDFYRAGIIPLNHLAHSDNEWESFVTYAEPKVQRALGEGWNRSDYAVIAQDVWSRLPRIAYDESTNAKGNLHRFASNEITVLTSGLSIPDSNVLEIPAASRMRAELMKKLAWYYVIDRPGLTLDQLGQRRIVRELFFDLHDMVLSSWDGAKGMSSAQLPGPLREFADIVTVDPTLRQLTDSGRAARAVTDYLCTLTDKRAIALWKRINGDSGAGFLTSWGSFS